MGGVPTTDAEGRVWHDVFNITDMEIPPFGIMYCEGKKFSGPYTEKDLPKEISEKSKISWEMVQRKVGKGNLLLMASTGYSSSNRNSQYYIDGAYFANGPTAIQPYSWGRGTNQWPAIVKCRGVVINDQNVIRFNTRGTRLSPAAGSFELMPQYTGFGSGELSQRVSGSVLFNYDGSGWYGSPEMFAVLDIVDGFDGKDGLAWVAPKKSSVFSRGFKVGIGGDIHSAGMSVDKYDLFRREEAWSVFDDADGSVGFNLPGFYDIDLRIEFAARVDDAYDGEENPWAQVEIRLSSPTANFVEFRSNPTAVTLAPPVIKQGSYGEPSTYLTLYSHAHVLGRMNIAEPTGFSPFKVNAYTLAKCALSFSMTTNAPDDLFIGVSGEGRIMSYGATAGDIEKAANA